MGWLFGEVSVADEAGVALATFEMFRVTVSAAARMWTVVVPTGLFLSTLTIL